MISQENYDILKEKIRRCVQLGRLEHGLRGFQAQPQYKRSERIRLPESVRIEHRLRARGAEPLR